MGGRTGFSSLFARRSNSCRISDPGRVKRPLMPLSGSLMPMSGMGVFRANCPQRQGDLSSLRACENALATPCWPCGSHDSARRGRWNFCLVRYLQPPRRSPRRGRHPQRRLRLPPGQSQPEVRRHPRSGNPLEHPDPHGRQASLDLHEGREVAKTSTSR
jgi:hypothetical protein